MADPFGQDFGGMMDDLFGPRPHTPSTLLPTKEEKGVPWAAKRIDGKLYVPLEQVAELLESNNVLPKVRKGLEKHLEPKSDTN